MRRVGLLVVALAVAGCARIAGIDDWRAQAGNSAAVGGGIAGAGGSGGTGVAGGAGGSGGGCVPETGRCRTEPCFGGVSTFTSQISPVGLAVGRIAPVNVDYVVLAGIHTTDGTGAIELVPNDSQGMLGPSNVLSLGSSTFTNVAVGALAPSATADVIALDLGGVATLFPSDGTGALSVGTPSSLLVGAPRGLQLARDDGQPIDRVFVAAFDAGVVQVYSVDSNAKLVLEATPALGLDTISAMVARDLDGDGLVDLAVSGATEAGPALRVSLFMPEIPGFGPSIPVPDSVGGSVLGAADVLGDGGIDLVELDAVGDRVVVHERVGGAWPLATSAQVGANPVAMAVGDVDGDGRADIAVADGAAPGVTVLLHAKCTGMLVPAFDSPYGTSQPLQAIATGRLDESSADDVVALEANAPYRVQVFRTGR